MFRWIKRGFFLAVILGLFWIAGILEDHETLKENVIRLHVVANSDSREDQELKLQVRDAVMEKLSVAMDGFANAEQAMQYLQEQLPQLQQYVNTVLEELGSACSAVVTLGEEAFGMRQYDTFSLPSGVYESLRITIGQGAGQNWWCLVFPNLCFSAAGESTEDVQVGAGFSESLSGALEGENRYRPRFFLLDCIGKLENLLFGWK